MTPERVKPGDPIRADAWNELVDAVGAVGPLKGGALQGAFYGLPMQALNDSDLGVNVYGCLAIVGTPIASANPEGLRDAVLTVRAPQAGDSLDALVVAIEPMYPHRCGRVLVFGLAWAFVDPATTGRRGTLAVGAAALTLGSSGPAEVLYHTPGANKAWIRFPAGSGGAASVFPPHQHLTATVGQGVFFNGSMGA